MWSETWRDLRLAARTLRGSPMFTLTAMLSLAIGIGGTAVIFGVVDAYLIRPWPGIADPERLVEVGRVDMDGPGPSTADGFSTFSYPNYQDYLERQTVFQSLAASRSGEAVGVGDGTSAVRVSGAYVSANYFSVLGTQVALGRSFQPEDAQLTIPATVGIISHRLWRAQFGGDANVVGRTVQLNGRPFTIVGVAAAGFNGHDIDQTSVWMPLTAFPDGDNLRRFGRRGQQWLIGIGRLKDGVSAAQARAEMSRIASDLAREYPDDNRRHGLAVEPAAALPVDGRSPISRFMALLAALTGIVLLVACTNVGGMVLARGVSRGREMAVRLALGAERPRLVRLLIAESVMVALAGSALGLLVAWQGLRLLGRLGPIFPIELAYDVQIDWRITAFSIGIGALTVILCGLLPAVQTTRIDLSSAIKPTSSGGPRRLRARQVLLAGQVALSMLLVVTAVLLGRSLTNANAIDPGFTLEGVDAVEFDLRLGGYEPAGRRAFFDQVMARVQRLPGLESAALARVVPLTREREGGRVWLPGELGDDRAITVSRNFVSPDYFRLLRIPLLRGRVFEEGDRAGAPEVAVVNETMAKRAWPGQDPVGQLLLQGVSRRPLLVVGLVRDTKYRTIGEDPSPFVYISAAQTNEAIMRLLDPREWPEPASAGARARRRAESQPSTRLRIHAHRPDGHRAAATSTRVVAGGSGRHRRRVPCGDRNLRSGGVQRQPAHARDRRARRARRAASSGDAVDCCWSRAACRHRRGARPAGLVAGDEPARRHLVRRAAARSDFVCRWCGHLHRGGRTCQSHPRAARRVGQPRGSPEG